MNFKCRCSKCRTRRSLSRHPDQFARIPKCHVVGCGGEMRVDKYRQRKGPKDNPAVCKDPLCQHMQNTGNYVPYHRVNSVGCSGPAVDVPKVELSGDFPF